MREPHPARESSVPQDQQPKISQAPFAARPVGQAIRLPRYLKSTLPLALMAMLVSIVAQAAADEYFVYFGTYTAKTSKGIHAYRFQPATGKLTPLGVVAEGPNPSFLATSPNRRYLYAVNWKGSETVKGDTVSAYQVDARTGKLTFLNKVSSRGEMPTHLAVDQTGRMLMTVNYGSGSVTSMSIGKDGRLSEPLSFDQHHGSSSVKGRQDGPHAHDIVYSPDNRFAWVADLGLDQVFSYRIDPGKATFTPNVPPVTKVSPGSGPRHLAFHPNGKFLYANNEINSTIVVFSYDATGGVLKELQTISTLPPGFSGSNSTAEIQTDPAGKFLYVSNRGHDSIAVFAIDSTQGTLTPVEHVSTQGRTPRNFSLDQTGKYLFAANENSDTVVLFRVDSNSGRLTPAGQVLDVPSPSCVIFLKAQ
jgi:6-phosphogluconolactonase